jgi:UPF0271 protein
MAIDINCDMGESFGNYKYGADDEVVAFITSANIACGFHAGDPLVMNRTVALAKNHGVAVGAHPSFPDLMGFGRREINATPEEVRDYVTYQVGAMAAFAAAHGVKLQHVKGHGSIYNQAALDPKLARALAEGVARFDAGLTYVGLAGTAMLTAAEELGLRTASEVFADRAYTAQGHLVSRRIPGAVIHDPEQVVKRVVRMAVDGTIEAITGEIIAVKADTVCVHGDTPGAATLAEGIRRALAAAGVEVRPIGRL